MPASFNMYVPTRFVFGNGRLNELHQQKSHTCFVRMAQTLGMKDATKPEDFITALTKLQEDCGVADLKMSDYGIRPDEFDKMATNARETMGGLFAANPCEMTHEDCVEVFRKSYR